MIKCWYTGRHCTFPPAFPLVLALSSSFNSQPSVLSTTFKSQLIKSHTINTPFLTFVLLCVCISLKYIPQSWRDAWCFLPKTLSNESKLWVRVHMRSQPVNICGLCAAIWIGQVEILGGAFSLWLTAVQMVYSCILQRELTLNIYNETTAERLAVVLQSSEPESSMKPWAILRAPLLSIQHFTQIDTVVLSGALLVPCWIQRSYVRNGSNKESVYSCCCCCCVTTKLEWNLIY